jgi:omega-amidase
MFNTGFTMNSQKCYEQLDGRTIKWMGEMADKTKAVVTGSFIVKENNHFYNRLIWMRPDGTYETYDKRHLFRMGDEDKHYSPGKTKIVTTIKDWRVCPLICYDLRFPVWSRNKIINGNHDYDVLIYVANWPERRKQAWQILLKARAIENQCYVVGVNRVGKDGHGIAHSGDSVVVNYKGEILSSIQPFEEKAETIILSYEELKEYRKTFPAGLDADDFELKVTQP